MILNQQLHNYLLLFPKTFFSEETKQQFSYYQKYMRLPYTTIDDFINSTIQNVNFPGWNLKTVEQHRMYGALQKFKDATPVKDLIEKTISIEFKLVDGFLNYFMLYDNAIKYLDFKNESLYFDDFKILLLNNENYLISYINLYKVIMKKMTNLRMGYPKMGRNNTTFTVEFEYNDWDLTFLYNDKLIQF